METLTVSGKYLHTLHSSTFLTLTYFIIIGILLLLCHKEAVERFILKRELLDLPHLRSPVSEDVLDSSLEEVQAYFTRYAWASINKQGIEVILGAQFIVNY